MKFHGQYRGLCLGYGTLSSFLIALLAHEVWPDKCSFGASCDIGYISYSTLNQYLDVVHAYECENNEFVPTFVVSMPHPLSWDLFSLSFLAISFFSECSTSFYSSWKHFIASKLQWVTFLVLPDAPILLQRESRTPSTDMPFGNYSLFTWLQGKAFVLGATLYLIVILVKGCMISWRSVLILATALSVV